MQSPPPVKGKKAAGGVASPPLKPRTTRTEELRLAARAKAKAAAEPPARKPVGPAAASEDPPPAVAEIEQPCEDGEDEDEDNGESEGAAVGGTPSGSGPTSPSELFASPPPLDPADPFSSPVRSSGAHKHFSSSFDVPAPDDESPSGTQGQGQGQGQGATPTPVTSLGGFIDAFEEAGDDDRDEEEIEMDARLANLRRLGDCPQGQGQGQRPADTTQPEE
jgi:hypothetical protein